MGRQQWLSPCLAIVLISSLASPISASPVLVDDGRVTTLDGIPYYVGGIAVSTLTNFGSGSVGNAFSLDIVPLTIINTQTPSFTADELNSTITDFKSQDDVFQDGFLQAVYLNNLGNSSTSVDTQSCLSLLQQRYNTQLLLTHKSTTNITTSASLTTTLPQGPYFFSAHTGHIFKAHRLYADDFLAFTQAIISDENGGFLSLPAATSTLMAKSIAVPSRLYTPRTASQPLAGLRFAVKDIYHIAGVRTSGGNRAYYSLYPPQPTTAPSVQRLLDAGAVLVGKTGTVQFANGDRPTADWVDLHAPFNPRADGYQDPSGSSTGSGAAVAAYAWLDVAVGSDTGGSMRGPAGSQGLFGNRPSTGAVPMEHVIPLSPALDTAGVFARSGALWADVTSAWYEGFEDGFAAYPKSVYLSSSSSGWSDGADGSEAARALYDGFVSQLEAFLGANGTAVNVTQRWSDTRDAAAPESVDEMLYLTYGVLTSVDQFNLLGRPLFEDYAAEHEGRRPFINPGPLARWRWGQAHGGNATYEVALQNMTTFRTWWERDGYGRNDSESCSEGVYVYMWSSGSPSYRNEYFDAPTQPPLGFSDWAIAGYAGAPEVVVPIGEVPYNSTVSETTEYLPVTVSLQVARGCDLMLANLVKSLEVASIVRPVVTGPRIYG